MKQKLMNCFVWIVNRLSQLNTYDWSSEFKEEELKGAFKAFYEELRKEENSHLIDFSTINEEEALELRFRKWTSNKSADEEIEEIKEDSELTEDQKEYQICVINKTRNLMLVPLYLKPLIPIGTELTCINGEKVIYDGNNIDDDTRFGCLAYGITIKEG